MNHHMFLHAAAIVLTALVSPFASAGDGALDLTYSSGSEYYGGRLTIPFDLGGGNTDQAFGSVLQPDGKLVIVGSATSVMGDKDFAITRLMPDGSLDATFGINGKTTVAFDLPTSTTKNDIAHGVALQPNGKIVVVGTADGTLSGGSGASSVVLAQLMPDGSRDVSFGTNGKAVVGKPASTQTGLAVAIYQGTIFAVGSSDNIAYRVVLDATGNFQGSGAITNFVWIGTATSVSFNANGHAIVSGYYRNTNTNFPPLTNGYDCFVTSLRTTPPYNADSSFGTNGVFTFGFDFDGNNNDFCWGHAIQRDGKIVVVGQAEDVPAGATQAAVARIEADGTNLDTSFGGSGTGKYFQYFEVNSQPNVARAIGLQSDGKIIVAGYGSVLDPARAPFDFGVMRLNQNGSSDPTFVGNTAGSRPGTVMIGFEDVNRNSGEDDGSFALSIDSADRVYAVGQAQSAGADYDMAVARLQSDKIFVDGFESP